MSLADELLADLESDEEQEEELTFDTSPNHLVTQAVEASTTKNEDTDITDAPSVTTQTQQPAPPVTKFDDLIERGEDITAQDLAERFDFKHVDDVKSVSNLMSKLSPILEQIETYSQNTSRLSTTANVEKDPEYQLLVEANSYSVEIDSEILVVHQFVKEHYAKRFKELESLVPAPVDYVKAVMAIGNKVNDIASTSLKGLLPGATFMIITMSAFESKGQDLTPAELESLFRACELVLTLDNAKTRITEFVSSRMNVFAPNLAEVVGPHTAAQLIGFSGGLLGLSKTPNSNIAALGSRRQVNIGFGHTGIRQQGFLYHSDIVQSVAPEYRQKAMRIVSGKLVLAARVDLAHSASDGAQGRAWREQINHRIEKLLEPPENKAPKALPIPMDMPSKKRGGKRIRKFKEQFQQTELQKARNRMTFGGESEAAYGEEESSFSGLTSGAGGSSGSGNAGSIRAIKIDNKTKARMSKGMQARLNGLSSVIPGGNGHLLNGGKRPNSAAQDLMNSGMASSLSFTPVQGIELIDPSRLAQKRKAEEEDRWFKSGTFTQINPQKSAKRPGVLELGGGSNNNNGGTMAPPPPVIGIKRTPTSDMAPPSDPKRQKN
ncbi:hypothetical protein DV451_000554 [Geotrichum candidum]|uniref:Nop domain-containing protein n=1 Tax=Geotrichum candidum TaxID=1173061 RepID=A0A9P5G9N5_GEOCN|nr:hypothetical protein DV451_000554 [Geotrichum candidum]